MSDTPAGQAEYVGACTLRLEVDALEVPLGGTLTGALVLTGGAGEELIRRLDIDLMYQDYDGLGSALSGLGPYPAVEAELPQLRELLLAAGEVRRYPIRISLPERGPLPGWLVLLGRATLRDTYAAVVGAHGIGPLKVQLLPPDRLAALVGVLAEVSGLVTPRYWRTDGGDGVCVRLKPADRRTRELDEVRLELFVGPPGFYGTLDVNPREGVGETLAAWITRVPRHFAVRLDPDDLTEARQVFQEAIEPFRRVAGPVGDLPLPGAAPRAGGAGLPRTSSSPEAAVEERPIPSSEGPL
jgi:hypothetical protein